MQNLLDTDLYKLTMQQVIAKKFSNVQARYTFINRGTQKFSPYFFFNLQREVDKMACVDPLNKSQLDFLRLNCPFLEPEYLQNVLASYRFDPSEIDMSLDASNNLNLTIEGSWLKTILWEVPLMAAISETYFTYSSHCAYTPVELRASLKDKADRLKAANIKVTDFGTRRRFSQEIHRIVVHNLSKAGVLNGTSNVMLAEETGLKPVGTMAHEFIQASAAMYGYKNANAAALNNWVEVYGNNLSIALPDTFTTDVFLQTFDKIMASYFNGLRQDSGDPFRFTDKVVKHYQDCGIDPKTKTIIYSDGLDVDKAIEINNYAKDKVKVGFGIGTNLTNDIGVKPLNIVIKLTAIRITPDSPWIDCVKLSDVLGKVTGNLSEVEACKKSFELK